MSKKSQNKPKHDPPVMFRPGNDLGHIVAKFAASRGVGVNEAFKSLSALATAGLDLRYFDLLTEMAHCMGGRNAFVRAVLHILTALMGAAQAGVQLRRDADRSSFVINTVMQYVTASGCALRTEVVQSLRERLGLTIPVSSGDDHEFTNTGFQSTSYDETNEPPKVKVNHR
jgi:hypothetical protein